MISERRDVNGPLLYYFIYVKLTDKIIRRERLHGMIVLVTFMPLPI